jgi:hypothetical protein
MDDPRETDEIETRCEGLQYPVMRSDAAAAFSDVTVETGGEERNLGVLISESDHDSFVSPDELYAELADTVGE